MHAVFTENKKEPVKTACVLLMSFSLTSKGQEKGRGEEETKAFVLQSLRAYSSVMRPSQSAMQETFVCVSVHMCACTQDNFLSIVLIKYLMKETQPVGVHLVSLVCTLSELHTCKGQF